jgi:hypothetical protein
MALIERLLEVDRRLPKILLQHEIVEIEYFAELCGEALALEEIGDTQRPTRHLVLVRRSNTAAGRADRIGASRLLSGSIKRDVRRQDERTIGRDTQTIEDGYAAGEKHVRFTQQRLE